jgi:hypothetical protein
VPGATIAAMMLYSCWALLWAPKHGASAAGCKASSSILSCSAAAGMVFGCMPMMQCRALQAWHAVLQGVLQAVPVGHCLLLHAVLHAVLQAGVALAAATAVLHGIQSADTRSQPAHPQQASLIFPQTWLIMGCPAGIATGCY